MPKSTVGLDRIVRNWEQWNESRTSVMNVTGLCVSGIDVSLLG